MGGTSSKLFIACLDIERLKARLAETNNREALKRLEAVNKPFLFNNAVILGKQSDLEKLFSLEKIDDIRTLLDLQPPVNLANVVILKDCVRMANLGQKFVEQAESEVRDPFEERVVSEEELLDMEEYGHNFVRFDVSKILWSVITLSTRQDRPVEESMHPGSVVPKKPTVQLDIPAKWLLWNLYEIQERWKAGDLSVLWIRWRNRYARCPDPMDDLGFDDETSFPSTKPNRDVFGPPRRSRRQRGWYQIKHCLPRQECCEHSVSRSSQIPPELFDTFLRHRLQLRRCTTKDLAQLRLVCRRWAELLRDKMFHVVYLRGYQDVHSLSALMGPPLACSQPDHPLPIRQIELCMNLSTLAQPYRSWLGLFYFNVLHRLRPADMNIANSEALAISGPLPAGRRLTSVHLTSPCRSPWQPLPIERLNLRNIHFGKFDDLVQLLRELPKLQTVEGYGLTWNRDLPSHGINERRYPSSRTAIPSSNHSSKIEYFLRGCQPPLAGWLACVLSRTTKSAIVPFDLQELCAIISTLAGTAHGDSIYPYSTRFEDGLSICHWDSSTLPTLHVWLTAPQNPRPSSSGGRSVRLIVFKFGKEPVSHGAFKAPEWNAVDKCIANLHATSAVCFIFSCLEHAEYFHKDVLSRKMPVLRGSMLFRYMLDDENNRKLSVLGRGDTFHVIAEEYYSDVEEGTQHPQGAGSWAHALQTLSHWTTMRTT